MSIRELVRADYKEYISLNGHRYPQALIEALKHNERVPGLIDNLSKELTKVEKRRRLKLTRNHIKESVYSFTEMFLNLLNRKALEDSMSAAERSRIVNDARAFEELSRQVVEEDSSEGFEDGRRVKI